MEIILKIRMAVQSFKDFFVAEQLQPLNIAGNQPYNAICNNNILPGNYQKLKMKIDFEERIYNKPTSEVKINDIESNKQFDHLDNTSGMTSAQIVYAVIHKQQIEWMKDCGKKTG